MMAETTGLPFEKKAIIPIDPRTKIFLTVTVSTIMVAGGNRRNYDCYTALPDGVPYVLAALIETMEMRSEFSAMYAVLFALELTVLQLLTGTWNFVLGAAMAFTHICYQGSSWDTI